MATKEKLRRLPSLPGVYIFKSSKGEVLYIGKAKSLKNRVRSYFTDSTKKSDSRYAVRFLAERTEDIEYIVTTTEKEALILEDTLLKKHRPRYNIRLKDDKTYLSIKLTVQEEFPRLLSTRRIKKDGSRYFGPYASAGKARETIKLLRRIFPLCVCSPSTFKNMVRPCLDHQLGICAAPAVGLITKEAYAEIVDGAIMLLEGKNRQLIKNLKAEMKEASKTLDFEGAAIARDRIEALTATLEEQKVVSIKGADQDIVAFAREDKRLGAGVLQIRDGRLIASKGYIFVDTLLPIEEILSSFLTQFYKTTDSIPKEVIVGATTPDSSFIEDWLT
ncbi:MAG: excinuclease ABC subunit C, partial [Proteobacteria bacterium]|nr:excinuclease ABC subunit C [Pseudomonadota bacterium]